MKWEKGLTMLHVTAWDEPGALREVRIAAVPDSLAFHVPCWIESNNSRQLLPVTELFPLRMRDALIAHQTETRAAKDVLLRIDGKIYKLLNER